MTGPAHPINSRSTHNERRFHLNHHNHEPTRHEHDVGAENEAHAHQRIDRRIEQARAAGHPVDAGTARLIAASLHSGIGSELEIFAASGQLHPARALAELDEATVDLLRLPWAAALTEFLDAADHSDATDPDRLITEPAPAVYLDNGTVAGCWVNLTAHEDDLTDALRGVSANQHAHQPLTITAAVGFHGHEIDEDADVWSLRQIALGIATHGEAYAAYAFDVAPDGPEQVDEVDFRRHYYGTVASLEHFVMDRAEDAGWLEALSRFSDRHGLRGLIRLDLDAIAEQLLTEGWSAHNGADGLHIFGPARPAADQP